MELSVLQNRIKEIFEKFYEKRGIKRTKEEIFIHLVEEIGEIARQLVNEKIRRDYFDRDNLAEEIADTIIFLIALASYYEINIEKAIERDLEKLKNRIKIE